MVAIDNTFYEAMSAKEPEQLVRTMAHFKSLNFTRADVLFLADVRQSIFFFLVRHKILNCNFLFRIRMCTESADISERRRTGGTSFAWPSMKRSIGSR